MTSAAEVQWSELQRDAKAVAETVDRTGQVRVRRRDGVPLVLVREDQIAEASAGAREAARVFRNLVAHVPARELAVSLLDELPWLDLLPGSAQQSFFTDFARAFEASAELGKWSLLHQLLTEWKATAAIYADVELADHLTGPIDGDLGSVTPPLEDN
jgi:hypothetical protein